MASFCSQCGRPLQEGEVCNCQQQNTINPVPDQMPNQMPNQMSNQMPNTMPVYGTPNGQAMNQVLNEGKNIFQNILGLFKDPAGTIKRIADENKMMTPLIMVITNIVVTFLLSIMCMIVVRVKLGDYADYISIPYVRIVLVLTLLSAIFDFALAGLMLLSSKVFFKDDFSFAKALTVTGAKVILSSIFAVCAVIFTIIAPTLGMIINLVGMLFTSLVFILGYMKISVLSDTKKFYSLFVTIIMQIVAMALVYLVLVASIIQKLGQALSYLM